MVQLAETVWRDFVTDGVPSSGDNDPRKRDIREWGAYVEAGILGGEAGTAVFADKASMDAELDYDANTMAWVIGDAAVGNNGIYQKVGASGSGSWVRISDLPFSFIKATNAGAGSPNAIVATTTIPVPTTDGAALVALPITTTNNATPVTVSFNGETDLTIKTNSGNDPVIGGLVAGTIVAGYLSGTTFRLLSDQASAAIQAAAEQAVIDAQALVDNAQVILDQINSQIDTVTPSVLRFSGDDVTTTFNLGVASTENLSWVFISGVYQQKDTYSLTGTDIIFDAAPPTGTGNIEVVLAGNSALATSVPGPNSVGPSELQNAAVTEAKLAPDVIDLIEAGASSTLGTLSDLSAADIGSRDFVRLAGRTSIGDGGAMLLRNIGAGTPAVGYPTTTSADGSKWEFVPTDWSVTFEMFGAVGDGVTDDYAACQAAVDFIYARGGGTIHLGWNKIYALSDTLFIWQRVRLIGVAGAWMNQYSTGAGLAAPVPLGSAFYLKDGVNKDLVQFRFNCFNDGGTLKEVGTNRFMSDFRHHGGAIDVCFWGNRGPLGTPPTGKTNNNLGSACAVYGARYVWLERCAGMFAAENGFKFVARNYTTDFGVGGLVGSNNQRVYYNNGHGNAMSGFLVAMYDSIVVGNDAGFNGEDGYTGYGGQLFNNNAAWNNLERGFNIGVDSGFTTTSALSATFVGNNSYDNEWAGFRMSGNGCPLVVGCFARANGRGKVGADTDNANYVITSTARGSGFVGCQSAAWDYDAVTPLTYFGFFVSNPTYKTAFSGNIDRGCTVPKQVSDPGNILASSDVT